MHRQPQLSQSQAKIVKKPKNLNPILQCTVLSCAIACYENRTDSYADVVVIHTTYLRFPVVVFKGYKYIADETLLSN